MAEVILKDLVKVYPPSGKNPAFKAVKEIDLTICDREFMVLVGPSGCGKSTTLRMIAGLEEVTGGAISISGRVVNSVEPKDRDIAMVFQNYALYPHMTVFDNMAFGLKLKKLPKTQIHERVQVAAEILGIESLLDRKPKALSGGQRQRVAVGRAIVRDPKVFLFDEPLSNLDAKMRVSMRTEISRLHARLSATMIYVTHDQMEAMTMGDRICVMKEGHIMQVDEPLQIYNHPENMFVAGFIGSPPMNFFHGFLKREKGRVVFQERHDSEGFSLVLDDRLAFIASSHVDQAAVLGIRPEDIAHTLHEANAREGQKIHATVQVSEPMGSETYLYMDTAAHSFNAKVQSQDTFRINQCVEHQFNLEKAHIFDPKTEEVLGNTR